MRRSGVSTAVIAVVVIVIVVVAGAGIYFATRPSSTTSTTQSTTTTTSPTSTTAVTSTTTSSFSASTGNNSAVLSQVNLFFQAFDNRDVEGLVAFYTPNAMDNWTGNTQGLGGFYQGTGNIRILYDASVGHTTRLTATPSELSMVTTSSTTVNATMNIELIGASTALGNLTIKVAAWQIWVNQAGTWSIENEQWDYKSFIASNPVTSTVFPQWGLQISGKNPDLASEHKFEWNTAPVLAVALYVSIIGVALVAVLGYRHGRRPGKISAP